jgi:hypothetical protein
MISLFGCFNLCQLLLFLLGLSLLPFILLLLRLFLVLLCLCGRSFASRSRLLGVGGRCLGWWSILGFRVDRGPRSTQSCAPVNFGQSKRSLIF